MSWCSEGNDDPLRMHYEGYQHPIPILYPIMELNFNKLDRTLHLAMKNNAHSGRARHDTLLCDLELHSVFD
jgi:hypothetical protein